MATYSYRQLEILYVQAGGSAKLAPTMAAIAKAESGGVTSKKHYNNDGSIDQGLWQINSSNSALYQGKNIYDPMVNAKVAVRLAEHSGNKLKNWVTYTTGAFRKYLPKALKHKPGKSTLKSFGIYTQGNYAGTDQGVDYRGKGAIPALGSGVVTDVGTTHIIEGGGPFRYVIYRLTSGPYKGHFVYVAENFAPKVRVGTKIKLGQTIGIAPGVYPYTETGFNKTGRGWNPVAPLNPSNPHAATPAGSTMLSFIQGVEGLKHGGGSFLGGVESGAASAATTAENAITNPYGTVTSLFGKGASAAAGAAGLHPEAWIEEAITKTIDAFAIVGGGIIFVLGFVLVAADIGLSTKAGKVAATIPAARIITKSAAAKTSRRSSTAGASAASGRAEERREEMHQANLKKTQAQTTEIRTRQKNRRKNAKEQKAAETKSYYAGARDAASPTMAKIRKTRGKRKST